MRIEQFVLPAHSTGTERTLTSLHFGTEGQGRKVYIQAGLHASEIPGLLVAHYLRQSLASAERNGELTGQVVLVPVCNPIGLDQTVLTYQLGRFDLASGRNFNRRFPWLADQLTDSLREQLGQDAGQNVRLIRAELKRLLSQPCGNQLDAMQQRLSWLSCDADLLLDLHCDGEAVIHVYTHTRHLDLARQVSAVIGAEVTLHAEVQGGESFDENHTEIWLTLARHFPTLPIPPAGIGLTLELRGQRDVSHERAQQDAARLMDLLRLQDVVSGNKPVVPPLKHEPTPLAGTEVLYAPGPGVIAYHKACGDMCHIGDAVVDIIDPVSGQVDTCYSSCDGILYVRQNRRYATTGMDLAYIAGHDAKRRGMLLSA